MLWLRSMLARACILLTLAFAACEGTGSGDDGGQPDALAAPAWQSFPGAPRGLPRWGMPVVHLPSERRYLGFGGALDPDSFPVGETWSFSMRDRSWSLINNVQLPPAARFRHCATYLPEQGQVLIIGGRDKHGALPPAAWTFDIAARDYRQVGGPVPDGVIGCQAAHFERTNLTIVFGGASDSGPVDGTWSYDPTTRTFTRLAPAASPPARSGGVMVYDPEGDGRVLLFGGETDGAVLDDVWAFDGTTWSAVGSGPRPPARHGAAAGFDRARHRIVVFGGAAGGGALADLWSFDAVAATWTRLEAPATPGARGFAAAAYDPIDAGLVVWGGLDPATPRAFSDGWMLHMPILRL